MIDPISPLPAVVALLVAMTTTSILVKKFGAPAIQGRFASIDGLRGYLAFFVFLHHSCIWYYYLKTDQWESPPSNLYTHFGESSVIFFFMITGFLFFSKLIKGKEKSIDWNQLFISRLLRLTPLYFFVIVFMFIIVASLSNWTLNEPLPKLIKGIISWFSFSILGSPDINGFKFTSLILASVIWTLPYEWFFYINLPILARFINVKPPIMYIVFSIIASGVVLSYWHPGRMQLLPFLSGITTAVLVRSDFFKTFALKKLSSFIIFGCICIAVICYPTAYRIIPIILLSISFALIAGGNSFFGVLLSPVSRALGEITYSIYLLHGVTLFCVFTFFLGTHNAKALSPINYWFLVVCITPILILVSFFTFRLIERPAMQFTTTLTAWLNNHTFLQNKESIDCGTRT